jgi:hypothetical protein
MMMVMELPSTKSDSVWCEISRKWEFCSSKFIWDASDVQIVEPIVPPCEDWSTMEKLKEKEVVGIYISDIR